MFVSRVPFCVFPSLSSSPFFLSFSVRFSFSVSFSVSSVSCFSSVSLPFPGPSWDSLSLPSFFPPILRTLTYPKPLPLQVSLLPSLMDPTASDVFLMGETGSGKTLTYLLAVITNVDWGDEGMRKLQAVIMVPTRELVMQVGAVVHGLLMEEGEEKGSGEVKRYAKPRLGKKEATPYCLLYKEADESFLAKCILRFKEQPCPLIITTPGAFEEFLTNPLLMDEEERTRVSDFWYHQKRLDETVKPKMKPDRHAYMHELERVKKARAELNLLSHSEILNAKINHGVRLHVSMAPMPMKSIHNEKRLLLERQTNSNLQIGSGSKNNVLQKHSKFGHANKKFQEPSYSPSESAPLGPRPSLFKIKPELISSFSFSKFYSPIAGQLPIETKQELNRAHIMALTTNQKILANLRYLVLDEAETILQPLPKKTSMFRAQAKSKHPTSGELVLERLLACYSSLLKPSPYQKKDPLNGEFVPPDLIPFFRIICVSATLNNALRSYIHRLRFILGSVLPPFTRPLMLRPPEYYLRADGTAAEMSKDAKPKITKEDIEKLGLWHSELESSVGKDGLVQIPSDLNNYNDIAFVVPKSIQHRYMECEDNLKLRQFAQVAEIYFETCKRVLETEKSGVKPRGILLILADTSPVKLVVSTLVEAGFNAVPLHSQFSPLSASGSILPTYQNRNFDPIAFANLGVGNNVAVPNFLNKMESGEIEIAVTTASAARGLDIPSLLFTCLVFSPTNKADYLHLSGRVSRRRDQLGLVLSILSEFEIQNQLPKNATRFGIEVFPWSLPIDDENIGRENPEFVKIAGQFEKLVKQEPLDLTEEELNQLEENPDALPVISGNSIRFQRRLKSIEKWLRRKKNARIEMQKLSKKLLLKNKIFHRRLPKILPHVDTQLIK